MSDKHIISNDRSIDWRRRLNIFADDDCDRNLHQCPALILNADFKPLSYYPLSIWPWQESVKAIFRGAVTVVSEYDKFIHAPSFEMKIPSVLALNEYKAISTWPAFTRFNVFLRDNWQCQYCKKHFKTNDLTFDHLIPRASGGITSWENIVTACQKCNRGKGCKSLKNSGLTLLKHPKQPTIYELQNNGKSFPPNFLHQSWGDFLYWDSELIVN